ncbi:MAG: Ig-like domain-containing protein [Nitrospiraceae bacterium]|nr:Ig-like domain-containing protein [Nitrospiraceae bacterium]
MEKKKFIPYVIALLFVAFVTGCGCGGGDEGPVLVSIEVSPANPSIPLGASQQFTATGIFSDRTTLDITEAVTWSSSDASVATVSNTDGSKGLTTSGAAGSTTVVATSGDVSGKTTLTVTGAALVSIAISPPNPSIALGTTQQFKATGTYTDGSTRDITSEVTWNSGTATVATISNTEGSKGLASSQAVGQTSIAAASGEKSASTSLTVTAAELVSIAVTPADPSVNKGMTQQFIATGTFTDHSTQDLTASAVWSSSDPSVALISNIPGSQGLASALLPGTIVVTANSGSVSGSTSMTVTDVVLVSIAVTPSYKIAGFGTTIQYTATGTYSDHSTKNITTLVTWTSSDTSIATISNAPGTKGLVTTDHKVGNTTIMATLGSVSGSALLVDP